MQKKKIIALLTVLSLLMGLFYVPGAGQAEEDKQISKGTVAKAATLSNPRIVADDTMEAGQKVTWDCVWFGSYPQAEVVTSAMAENYTPVGGAYLQEGDLVVDDAAYAALQNASETSWDANGDTTCNGKRYRRMKKGDATYGTDGSDAYYNWKNTNTWHYFLYQPIKWRVLSTDGSTALLLSDVALDDQKYNEEYTSVTWETSTIRSWLNGYGAAANGQGINYSGRNFLDTAFKTAEQSAIEDSLVVNEDNLSNGTEGGNDTTDKLFLLSESEAYTDAAKAHGFASGSGTYDEARRAKSSTYAKAMGAWWWTNSYYADYSGNCSWWLRSLGYSTYDAIFVYSYGSIYDNALGNRVSYDNNGVRAALHLNLASFNLYTYAGTVCSDGTDAEVGGGSGIQKPDETANPEETANPDETESPELTPIPAGGSLQCAPACSLAVNDFTCMQVWAYEDGKEELEELTDHMVWSCENENIATVQETGFVLPNAPVTYDTQNGTRESWRALGLVMVYAKVAGETVVTGQTSTGAKVSFKVTVSSPADESGESGNGGTLSLGENQSGTAEGGAVEFFPAGWSLKSTVFPIQISKSVKKDGSWTIKGAVGIGRSNFLDKESTWNQYKKNVNDANKYTGKVACLEQYKDIWGVKSLTVVQTDKFKVLPKLSLMGYFENTYDRNNHIIKSESKLAADAKWSGSISWQFVTPIGPLYLNLAGSGDLTGTLGGQYDYEEMKFSLSDDSSLRFTPSVSLEGGYGIDKVATIGAQGKMSVPITVIPASKGEFEAEASLHVRLVFVVDWTKKLVKYKPQNPLWDTTSEGKSSHAYAKSYKAVSIADGSFSEMDTAFAAYNDGWMGDDRGQMRMAERSRTVQEGTSIDTLQNGVLPATLPMQVRIGDKQLMVFQSYDDTRTTMNSSVLLYSVCEDGVWSEPAPVWDNGCADLYADLQVIGGKAVLVWQKEKKQIEGDVETDSDRVMREIAQNSEICFSAFDADQGKFVNPVYVTDNSSYDMMPSFVKDGEDVALSWVCNDSADLMQETGSNSICMAKWNGTSFEGEQTVSQAGGTVDDYVVYQDGAGNVRAAYISQTNGMKVVLDEGGRVMAGFSDLSAPTQYSNISGIEYEEGEIRLVSGGEVYTYDSDTDSLASWRAGESAFGSAMQYCTNGKKSAYVWSVYDEENGTGKIVASMKTEDGYSEPVVLAKEEGVMWRYLSPTLDDDGNWRIVANCLDVKNDIHSIRYITKETEEKLELAGVSVNEADREEGLTALDYFAVNTGDTTVEVLDIAVTLEDGTKITRKVPVKILPGESAVGTAYVDLSELDGPQDVTVMVSAEKQKDKSGCEEICRAGKTDVSVTATSKRGADEVSITATLSNKSPLASKTVLHLYGDEEKGMELGKSEELEIAASGSRQVEFTVAKKDIVYNENDAAYLTLDADVEGGDCDESNNVTYVILYKEDEAAVPETPEPSKTQEPNPSGNANSGITGGTQTAGVNPSPIPDDTGSKKPKVAKVKKFRVTARKKHSLTLRWKKNSKVAGYKIKVSRTKNFKKAKKYTIKNPVASYKIKNLKRRKKYYIRIRAYKIYTDENGNKKKAFGKWVTLKKKTK